MTLFDHEGHSDNFVCDSNLCVIICIGCPKKSELLFGKNFSIIDEQNLLTFSQINFEVLSTSLRKTEKVSRANCASIVKFKTTCAKVITKENTCFR